MIYNNNFSEEKGRITTIIIGEYQRVGNPCTTKPCLPGTVYAVLVDGRYYYLTVNGNWILENIQWDEYLPKERDYVKVKGYLTKKHDVNNRTFWEIEVLSLVKTQSTKNI